MFANRIHIANHGFVILGIFSLNNSLVHLKAGQKTQKSLFIRAQGLLKVKMTLLKFIFFSSSQKSKLEIPIFERSEIFGAEFGHFHSQNCQILIQNDYVGSFITVDTVTKAENQIFSQKNHNKKFPTNRIRTSDLEITALASTVSRSAN